MSHNVELSGIKFSDLGILEKAVKELIGEGVIQGEFKKGDVDIRGWRGAKGEGIVYHNTSWDAEHNHKCPAGILFPNEKYDIGFNWNAKENAYVPFVESSWRPPIAAEAGAHDVHGQPVRYGTSHALPGQTGDAGIVGQLSQRYALLMAERAAALNGLPTRRIHAGKGLMQLEVTYRG